MIDEITDVNPGEKCLMKMWNRYVLERRPIADSQLEALCADFLRRYHQELAAKRLRNNFALHLLNLSDHGALTPAAFGRLAQLLHALIPAAAAPAIAATERP